MFREPSYLDEEVDVTRPSGTASNILFKIIPYIGRYPQILILSILSVCIASLTVLGVGASLRYFVDYGFAAESSLGLTGSVIILFLVVVIMALSSYGRLYWVSQLSERVVVDLRQEIFSHLLKQDIYFFEKTSVGEIQSRMTTDTTLLQIVLGTSFPIALRNILIIAGGILLLFLTSPYLTGILLIIIPFMLIPILIYGKRVKEYSKLAQAQTASVSAFLDEAFGAIRTVFAFCRETYISSLFSEKVENTYAVSMKRVESRARLTAMVMVLIFGGISIMLWIGGQNVLMGYMTPGQLSAFLFYAAAVGGASGSLSEIHGDIMRAAGGVERIFEFLCINSTLPSSDAKQVLSLPSKGHIQFLNISFAYPSRPHSQVLRDVSFEVHKGETVALIGPSGVGKTTIFNLLLRFYDPQKGQIFIDGLPINNLETHCFRSIIGLVPQDPILFSTSFLENIRFSNLDATDKEVKRAAEAAYVADFIESLPQGYETHVGEKGVSLSGGQRQRIAIARAILKNPAILLLDEATSALDTESEERIQLALNSLKPNRTTLIIAHRQTTIEKADRVLSFGKEFIIENNNNKNFYLGQK
jgi:ATP-binding cassette subfamily B protein